MIDWMAFVVVALASLLSAGLLVGLYALGLRLLVSGSRPRASRIGAWSCFILCALCVVFGVYLIVPAFHPH